MSVCFRLRPTITASRYLFRLFRIVRRPHRRAFRSFSERDRRRFLSGPAKAQLPFFGTIHDPLCSFPLFVLQQLNPYDPIAQLTAPHGFCFARIFASSGLLRSFTVIASNVMFGLWPNKTTRCSQQLSMSSTSSATLLDFRRQRIQHVIGHPTLMNQNTQCQFWDSDALSPAASTSSIFFCSQSILVDCRPSLLCHLLFSSFTPCVTQQAPTWLMSCHHPRAHLKTLPFVTVVPHSSWRSSAQAWRIEKASSVKCHDQAALHKSTFRRRRYSTRMHACCAKTRCVSLPRSKFTARCSSPRSKFSAIVGLHCRHHCCSKEKCLASDNGRHVILGGAFFGYKRLFWGYTSFFVGYQTVFW